MPSDSPSSLLLQGKLLLADPSLRDGFFNRSVVLITEYQVSSGASGFILNSPTPHVVRDLLPDATFTHLHKLPVFNGGPVMHDQMTFTSFFWNQKHGLSWTARISSEEAAKQAHHPGHIVRSFIGYASWTAGQLENELNQNAWFVVDPPKDILGRDQDPSLWKSLMRQISPFHSILAEAPDHPNYN